LAVYGPPEGAVNQGDIWLNVPFLGRQELGIDFPIYSPGLVVSHSCDIDKYDEIKDRLAENEKKRFPILLAPVLGFGDLDPSLRGEVKSGRQRRYFYLPAEGRSLSSRMRQRGGEFRLRPARCRAC
jgi:hypothetical protein